MRMPRSPLCSVASNPTRSFGARQPIRSYRLRVAPWWFAHFDSLQRLSVGRTAELSQALGSIEPCPSDRYPERRAAPFESRSQASSDRAAQSHSQVRSAF